jgi:hypothetical protein
MMPHSSRGQGNQGRDWTSMGCQFQPHESQRLIRQHVHNRQKSLFASFSSEKEVLSF